MARIFIEGFECGSGTPPGWAHTGTAFTYQPASEHGMSGSYCVAFGQTTILSRVLPSVLSEIYVSFKYFAIPDGTYRTPLIGFKDINGTITGYVYNNIDQRMVFVGAASTYSTLTLDRSATNCIEIWYKPLNVNGRIIIKVNGAIFIDFTGDTIISGLESIALVEIGSTSGGSGGGYAWFAHYDDIVADDSDWIGNTYIQPILITGAGATTQWDNTTNELMTLDVAPGGVGWSVGQTIFGLTSLETCVISNILTSTTYVVRDRTGAFTLGETLSIGELMTVDGGAFIYWNGSTLTGTSSLTTCTIVRELDYYNGIVKDRSGDFTLGEIITDGTTARDMGATYPRITASLTDANQGAAYPTFAARANYECVQEVPFTDGDFITTNTTNDVDTYTMSNMVGDIAQINAVRIISRGLYEGTPTPTELKHVIRMGGTDYPGVDVHPPLSAGYVESLLLTRPTDSEPWEEADINSMEVGVKASA